jgi:hypothetical protein
VLLTTGLIGLLIGHWTAPSKTSGPQVVRFEGIPLAGAATAGPSITAAPSPSAKASTTSSAATEAKEAKEAESPKAKAPLPVKTSSSSLKKLEKSSGKQHQKEIEKLTEGGKPIETGG